MANKLYNQEYLEQLHGILLNTKQKSCELLNPKSTDTIVDVGCGSGMDAINLAQSGAKVYGFDNDEKFIKTAKKQQAVGLKVNFICADASNLPLENESVDKIRFDRVFQHLDNYDTILAEAYRLLKPGGQIQIIDPDYFSITFFLSNIELERKLLDNISYKRIPNSYKVRQIPEYLKNNKFEIGLTEIHYYNINDYNLAVNIIKFEEVINEELNKGNITENELADWNELKNLSANNFNFSFNMIIFQAKKL